MKKRVAILFHEHDRKRDLTCYAITFLAEHWRTDGHEVVFVFGVRKFVPADLALLHVDLSIVPEEYLALARRYPIALNSTVKDVRKSAISSNLVRPQDPYEGQVIVKSNLNYAGLPERLVERFRFSILPRQARALWFKYHPAADDSLRFDTPQDYRIYRRAREVPPSYFSRPNLVVEKFLPEMDNGLYHVRNYEFLGNRETWTRLASTHPIVNDRTQIKSEVAAPQLEIIELRRRLKFDYGKFDYVVHNGKVVLLDANKTTGASAIRTPELEAMRRHRAEGIYSYFCNSEGTRQSTSF